MIKALGMGLAPFALGATGAVVAAQDDDQAARKEKKICKTEKITGSLTRVRRMCLTQAEWARLSEITQKQVDDLERDGEQRTLQGRLGRDGG